MDIDTSERLAENQLIVLRSGENRVLEVQQGTVWLTVAGRIDDVFLSAGASHRLHGSGRTIIEPINGPALISWHRPQRTLRLFRLLARFAAHWGELPSKVRKLKSPAVGTRQHCPR